MTEHKQVPIEMPMGIAGPSFTADVGIAPLIRALWARGYRTTGSCEDQDGIGGAWVAFVDREQAERFAAVVGDAATILEAHPDDVAAADPDDPALRGAIGVGFRPWQIQTVLAAVEAS